MPFSANLGFLWNHLPLADAIVLAHQAGFVAVECHWPYEHKAADVKAALESTGLPMLGINTHPGQLDQGEFGLCALPDQVERARASIDQALSYAAEIGAKNVHVMAGNTTGDEAKETFISNLAYAAEQAKAHNITLLIEPLNHRDAPHYFLKTTDQAIEIIEALALPNLKLMFDCYHVQIMEGDICERLTSLLPHIGHIQFASVPARQEPDTGELNYAHIFDHIAQLGYHQPLGAEYKPSPQDHPDQLDLNWMTLLRRDRYLPA